MSLVERRGTFENQDSIYSSPPPGTIYFPFTCRRNPTGRLGMLVPVRCFTCGALIGDKYEEFARSVKAGDDPDVVLNSIGFKRYCCRRMFLSTVDVIDQILPYYDALARRRKEFESERE